MNKTDRQKIKGLKQDIRAMKQENKEIFKDTTKKNNKLLYFIIVLLVLAVIAFLVIVLI